MHRPYNPQRGFSPERDVRTWDDLAELLRDSPPTGLLWPLVGPRRSGKTWALRALERGLGDACIVDLTAVEQLVEVPKGRVVLIDEPGSWLLARDPHDARALRPAHARIEEFGAWCRRLRAAGRQVLVAMTPAEWAALAGLPGCVSAKDLQWHLRPLRWEQAARIALDEPARTLLAAVAAVNADWLRSPFLVMCILDLADQRGELAADGAEVEVPRLLADVCHDLRGGTQDYVAKVFYEGLDEPFRDALRAVVRRAPVDPHSLDILRRIGLVGRDGDDRFDRLRDPVLADHLPPPLRIHHISDIHTGPKSARRINAGGAGATAARLARAAGEGPVRDSYLEHVEQRCATGTGPHLVIASGDLTETGQPREYAEARAFLGAVAGLLQPHPDLGSGDARVLLVGGNHDVDWTRTRGANGARARHLAFAEAFADYPRPLLEWPPEARDLQVVRYQGAGVEVVLLGSAEHGGEIDEATEAVLRAAQAAAAEDSPLVAEELQKLRKIVNSDPGLVHACELQRLRAHRWSEPVRIAVLHHPVSPLPTATDVGPYAALLNAAAVKDACFDVQIQLVLHGHAHSQWFFEERWPSHRRPDHPLHIAAAPSLGSREVLEQNGYNEILVHREGDRYRVSVQGYVRAGETWREGHRMRPFAADLPLRDA